jgi:gas vesicle protein
MASSAQRSRLRRDIGASVAALSDADADALFEEAGEKYTDEATIAAYTRVLGLQGILADSARLTTYKQNESTENLSDIFKHLKELLKVWEDKVTDAIASAAGSSGAARFGSVRRKPATIKEYPG